MSELLIVVDYQNDFVDGSLGFSGAEKLEDGICKKIAAYRERGGEVLFTLDTHGKDYLATLEGKYLPVEHCIKGSDGWKLYGKVAEAVESGDTVIQKPSFGSAGLASYLKERKYDSIELVGLVSNICVTANAIIAKTFAPEAKVTVDASCTASSDSDLNEKCLDVMAGMQIEIVNRRK